jgi:acyl-CoA synthetase (NDP forming)
LNQTQKIITQAKKEGRKALLETEAKTICAEYGIPVTKFMLAKSDKEAAVQADQIGYPVVLKIVSPDIIHKTEAGGVIVTSRPPSMSPQATKKSSRT